MKHKLFKVQYPNAIYYVTGETTILALKKLVESHEDKPQLLCNESYTITYLGEVLV